MKYYMQIKATSRLVNVANLHVSMLQYKVSSTESMKVLTRRGCFTY